MSTTCSRYDALCICRTLQLSNHIFPNPRPESLNVEAKSITRRCLAEQVPQATTPARLEAASITPHREQRPASPDTSKAGFVGGWLGLSFLMAEDGRLALMGSA